MADAKMHPINDINDSHYSQQSSTMGDTGPSDFGGSRENKESPKRADFKGWLKNFCLYQIEIVSAHPHILVVSLLFFAALCTLGLFLIEFLAQNERDEMMEDALDSATETAQWFSDQLDQAILPLFTMAQFVQELQIFHDLPNRIGPANEIGSLPFMATKAPDAPVTHRNVTGVCDDPDLLQRFTKIASTVKRQAKMDGVLVNLQLAPEAVVCLLHPMVNTEDFPPGVVMNNTGAWGHDLLTDPARRFIAEATIPSDNIVIAGPLTLRQCQDCNPTVEKAFIARIPIEMEGHEIVVNGVSYNKWGFAVALINWNALIERSNVYQMFEERGLEFRLARTDTIYDPENGIKNERVVVLAETPEFEIKNFTTVSTPLETTNNEWVMTVGYDDTGADYFWEKCITIIVSLAISILIYTILVQNQNFTRMKKKYDQDVLQPQKLRLRKFLEGEANQTKLDMEEIMNSTPIADLFPHTTVLFADIVGFTAWSSEREAAQVFTLLQTIFYAFDRIARKRKVFKVETIGDCYVAVCGLPEPQPDHAVRMLKFARECMAKMTELVKRLETTLGPGTGELRLRVGLHSGPVTAGVLVGERSRFQLFGDTMNTASRMESSGQVDKIHMSQSTANLILEAGRRRWIHPRKDLVSVKGKGNMQTYWYESDTHLAKDGIIATTDISSYGSGTSLNASDLWAGNTEILELEVEEGTPGNGSKNRLVEWHVDSMTRLLQKIIAGRRTKSTLGKRLDSSRKEVSNTLMKGKSDSPYVDISKVVQRGETLLDEVVEVITLPKFDSSLAKVKIDSVKIKPIVVSQLRHYVTEVSKLYHDNPFHGFEHASHVTLSAHKLLSRIVTPDDVNYQRHSATAIASELHNYTFGITSDPLTHLAVVFSALVHDIDHPGVPNGILAKENPSLADKYKNKSIAEQNSVDIAWDMLMDPMYKDLQACLFGDESDLLRFRRIVVNLVLATDIFDAELKALREMRWDKAFEDNNNVNNTYEFQRESSGIGIVAPMAVSPINGGTRHHNILSEDEAFEDANRKATIVIEHIMQASDVAHTMQHFTTYKKWNERLFQELYLAYKSGRSSKDPSEGWYGGELWFFDNYVIPLAQKLEDCRVFGVASDECLFNALENRKEWEIKGKQLVAEMVSNCESIITSSSAEVSI